ncbi:S-layer homology domain-containing protein [Solibacillus silvestris]|uniref:S-layer homology domain-containing protein n=1 Tax=Solibacillus silvestris TaxID=76853 RepID=UPI003F804179
MKKLFYKSFITIAIIASPSVLINEDLVDAAYSNPFTDVKDSNSHADAILSLYNEGIITGMTDKTYEPGKTATRGDAALYLATALNLKDASLPNPGFKDVPTSSKYYGAVAALTKAGIVNGYEDEFRPNATLTRAQLAKMLTIGFDLQQSAVTTTKFADVNKLTDASTKNYIQTLVDYGITNGTTATTFSPNLKLTRAQLATFLFNALQATSDELTVISVE